MRHLWSLILTKKLALVSSIGLCVTTDNILEQVANRTVDKLKNI